MKFVLNSYSLQDIGKRTNQEDCFYPPFQDPCHFDATSRDWSFYDGSPCTDNHFFIVCDGMGGHDRGEVASQTVVMSMSTYLNEYASSDGDFSDDIIRQAVSKALIDLKELDDPNEERKMGTTMTLLKFHTHGATIAHIGDSRVYQFRPAHDDQPSKILFLTEDHTLVNALVRQGKMTPKQAEFSDLKHILSQAMTASDKYPCEVEINHITNIRPNDIFLLCSDGIYESLSNNALGLLLCNPDISDLERCQMLLERTIDNRDNHTAVIVRVKDVLNVNDKENSKLIYSPIIITDKEMPNKVEKKPIWSRLLFWK